MVVAAVFRVSRRLLIYWCQLSVSLAAPLGLIHGVLLFLEGLPRLFHKLGVKWPPVLRKYWVQLRHVSYRVSLPLLPHIDVIPTLSRLLVDLLRPSVYEVILVHKLVVSRNQTSPEWIQVLIVSHVILFKFVFDLHLFGPHSLFFFQCYSLFAHKPTCHFVSDLDDVPVLPLPGKVQHV
jgi:hypothetical protein